MSEHQAETRAAMARSKREQDLIDTIASQAVTSAQHIPVEQEPEMLDFTKAIFGFMVDCEKARTMARLNPQTLAGWERVRPLLETEPKSRTDITACYHLGQISQKTIELEIDGTTITSFEFPNCTPPVEVTRLAQPNEPIVTYTASCVTAADPA